MLSVLLLHGFQRVDSVIFAVYPLSTRSGSSTYLNYPSFPLTPFQTAAIRVLIVNHPDLDIDVLQGIFSLLNIKESCSRGLELKPSSLQVGAFGVLTTD